MGAMTIPLSRVGDGQYKADRYDIRQDNPAFFIYRLLFCLTALSNNLLDRTGSKFMKTENGSSDIQALEFSVLSK